MKKYIKILGLFSISFALLFVTPYGSSAAEEYANTAAIFEMGAGARTLSMGGAFIGLADDENAAVYNPAGLAFFDRGGVNTTYDNKFNELTFNTAVGAIGHVGVAGVQLSSGLIDVVDRYGIDTGETTSYSSTGLIGSFGLLTDKVGLGARNLGIGLQVRSYTSTLHKTTGSGVSLSLSTLYRADLGPHSVAQVGIVVPSVVAVNSFFDGFPLGKIVYVDSDGDTVHEELFPNSFGLGVGLKTGLGKTSGINMGLDWRAQGGFRAGIEGRFPVGDLRFGATGDGSITAGGGLRLGALSAGSVLETVRLDGGLTWQADLGLSWILSFSAEV